MKDLLKIEHLSTCFFTHSGIVQAVHDLSLTVGTGEILGIVGESGSGKSVSMMSVMRLIPEPPGRITSGTIWFNGKNLLALEEKEMEKVRGAEISMIFQDPMTSLNPTLTIGYQLQEALERHLGLTGAASRNRAAELLGMVNIPDPLQRLKDYPHCFSGGMRQRVMIALALSCGPKLLIADEPTTALDVTIQAQIIYLVKKLQQELGMSVIWITHDLGVVARIADRVMVTYAGSVVESAKVDDLFYAPRHPYTLGLLSSLPGIRQKRKTVLYAIPGQPPSLANKPSGCPFRPRCMYAVDRCSLDVPPLMQECPDHEFACWEGERTKDVWKGSCT